MIYRDRWTIWLTNHALKRAKYKGIYFDMIYATIRGGKIKRFGKNYIAFTKSYKRGKVICVGEIKAVNKIDIFTVEWG